MDLRHPTDLRNAIEAFFLAACREEGLMMPISPDAMAPLVEPGFQRSDQELIDIDSSRLREALAGVAQSLRNIGDTDVSRATIELALTNAPCHYLWLC